MHQRALEGKIFYNDALAAPEYQKKYFPPSRGQSQYSYDQAPKVVIPISRTFINRISALLHNGMEVEFDTEGMQEVWNDIASRIKWNETTRNLLVNSMIGGNALVVLRPDMNNQVALEEWQAPFVFADDYWVGYEYILRNGVEMIPITSEPNLKDNEQLIQVPIDDFIFGNVEHGLGYTPAQLFKSIDRDSEGNYGLPYYLRFRDLNIEYNQVFSQTSKAIKILQNVWVSTADPENPDNPISLDPEKINFVSEKGTLQQVTRQLDTDPETQYLSTLLKHIHNAAQIPDFISGLSGVGKIESGVALQIVSGPLLELMTRVRNEYKEDVEELVTKIINTEFRLLGVMAPQFEVNVKLNENILPVDKQQEVDNLLKLVNAGIITADQAGSVVKPLFGLEE